MSAYNIDVDQHEYKISVDDLLIERTDMVNLEKTFTTDEVDSFLRLAPDPTFLEMKMSETERVVEDITEQSVSKTCSVDREYFDAELQKYYSGLSAENKKTQWTNEKIQNVIQMIKEYNLAKIVGQRPSDKQYYNAKKYDIMNIGDEKVLILKRKFHSDPTVRIIPSAEFYQRIHDAHIETGHGRRDKIIYALKDKYLVPIWAINIFLKNCKTCLSKKSFRKRVNH